VVTIAGSLSETVWRPPSTSRVTLKSRPHLELEAKVPCDQPSRAASIWPVWFESSSIACLPRMTRPGCSFVDHRLQDLGDRERLDNSFGLHQDAAVGAHGETGADRLRRLRRADRDHHDSVTLPLPSGAALPRRRFRRTGSSTS
jgi:hypothetical protein